MANIRDIENLLKLDNNELFLIIGNEIRGKGAAPAPKKQIILQANQWFSDHVKEIKEMICRNSRILTLANKDKSGGDIVMLISAIADLITSLTLNIAAISVAILIVREGLLKFCENYWK